MPPKVIQQRFTSGEFDPLLDARSDTEFYFSGAEQMRNVFVIPQGGFKRRPGLEHIDVVHEIVNRETSPTITTPNGGTGANANDDNVSTELITTTSIGTTDPYSIVEYNLGSAKSIAFVDVVGARLTSATNTTEFFIQHSDDAVVWTSIGDAIPMSTTDVTERRRFNITKQHVRFARIGSTDLTTDVVTLDEFHVWVDSGTLSEVRLAEFEFNVEQSYMLLFSDKNIAVYRDGLFQVDVRAVDFTSARLDDINWTQSADTGIFVQEDIQPHSLVRGSTDKLWTFSAITFDFIPKHDFVPAVTNPAVTLTPSAVSGTVTLTASGAVFAAGSVDQFVDGNGGRARIIKFTSTTVVTAVTIIPFYDTTAIASGDWEFQQGFEDVWSTTRGQPKSVTFHEGRLWFGASKERPQTLWASRIGQFFNFDPGALGDDEGIDVTLNTDQVNGIVNIVSQRTFQIFTTGGEFAAITPIGQALTPTTINIQRQTQRGSEEGLRTASIEGGTLFVQRRGKTIQEFIFNDVENAFTTNNISLLSSSLVITPVDLALRKSTSTEDASLLLVVNSNGTLMTAALLPSQNVIAFTLQNTTGTFLATGVDIEDMYFVVERSINSVTKRFLERFNELHFTDGSSLVTTGLPTDTFTGLDHLEGELCRVRADGNVLQDRTPSSGSVTIERDATTSFEIGLNFNPNVITLSLEVPQFGTGFGRKKRISEITVRVNETSGIRVNGNIVSFKSFGEDSLLDKANPVFTGDKTVEGVLGWEERQQVTITQVDPLPMTVLAFSMEVNF